MFLSVMTNLLYEPYRRDFPEEQKMTSKLSNAFLFVIRAYNTGCIYLKMFKHRPEPIAEIEKYHPYRQIVEIKLCIL